MADSPAPARKKRPPPKRVTVKSVERLRPKLVRVTFTGEELAKFTPPRPGAHIKLLFVPEGESWSPADADAPRPPSRTYTPRRFDPDALELDVEFVLHGDGLAANWVRSAAPGDELFVGGPGGGYDVPEDAAELVMLADDTATPAAGTLLEALPAGCTAHVFCEIEDAGEERPLSASVGAETHWLHRAEAGARAGVLLEAAVRAAEFGVGAYYWIACEAAAMRRIRDHLKQERGVDASRLHTRGYWRLGETNYPDHDYGAD